MPRGSMGGGRGRQITEKQHDEAMRVLRAEYYQGVRSLVEDLKRAIKDGEVTDDESMNDWIHQTVDGSYWVIYTHANFQVLLVTDNHDAYAEDFGEPPVTDGSINWAALAFAAMDRDLRQQIEAEGVDPNERPRGRRSREAPAPRAGERRRGPSARSGGRKLGRHGR